MEKFPFLLVVLEINGSNEERMEAFELYKKAFNAKKISGDLPPDNVPPESLRSDELEVHILMEINGYQFGIFPGEGYNSRGNVCCQFEFDNEDDLRKAYDVLSEGASEYSMSAPFWCKLHATVTDKYSILWSLCVPD
ncbi:MAG: hypothetical protein FWE80_07925 [Oscillospiraceae bacterium]|nr:hypothetical protein [Oscillospiraceae bacterium]